ncbi:hypothetical protein GGR28_000162 [Lewinella aquimaris]|uniref:Peptidase M12B domain-containing protein n=1 Tax=Neolewinella aquimaris TaxID=1835722 RepID=A0A840DX33_9BACT|nr:zinc-dependent metalloprotease [Neolewinella aquimaris]MBB4077561.1 hypothetical protein [Neolewinella aquimaris]
MNNSLRSLLGVAACVLFTGLLFAQQHRQPDSPERHSTPVRAGQLIPTTLPDGTTVHLNLQEVNVMSADLTRAAPDIYTFRVANEGLRGAVTLADTQVLGDIEYRGEWLSLRRTSLPGQDLTLRAVAHATPIEEGADQRTCATETLSSPTPLGTLLSKSRSSTLNNTNGKFKRTYRLAVAATGEFYAGNGANVAQARATIVQTVSFLNLIFENDLAVTFTLVDPKIYEDPDTDPFQPDQMGGDRRVNQAAEVIADNFPDASYDVGMVFHQWASDGGWNSGGSAYVGVLCDNDLIPKAYGSSTPNEPDGKDGPYKAGGWSGSYSNTSIGWKRMVSHELAHMLGGTHTFNGAGTNCTSANISGSSAVEIGSGTTLLSYANLCNSAYNVPYDPVTSSYFHQFSIAQMLAYLEQKACAQETNSNNSPPQVNANPCSANTTIPSGTPFLLRGSASDTDVDDRLTYSWEQIDEDGAGTVSQGATLNEAGLDNLTAGMSEVAPLFRSYPASTDPVRRFPSNPSGQSTEFEVLPEVARVMTFALTVRDNHPGAGGMATESVTVNVDQSGPLVFHGPASTAPLVPGEAYTFSWDPNGSEDLCGQVTVEMALNDSDIYAYSLGTVAYADGTANLQIPAGVPTTDRLRFRLICSDTPCQTFYAVDRNLREVYNENCTASATNIYPQEYISAEVGSRDTELELSTVGETVDQLSISGNLGEQYTGYAYRRGKELYSGCTKVAIDLPVDHHTIVPSESGDFRFAVTSRREYLGITIYEESFDPENGCATWINSMFGNGIYHHDVIAPLVAGKKYVLTVSTYDKNHPVRDENPLDYSIQVVGSPEGNKWIQDLAPAPGYDYTYLAVAQEEGEDIRAVSSTADFSLLTAGNYRVYGIAYPVSTKPRGWVGNKLTTVVMDDAGGCRRLSDNSRSMSLVGAQAVVPVEWLSFTGTPRSGGIGLHWSVASETQNDYFDVQRSSDGKQWQDIGRVSGAGSSNQLATYRHLDSQPVSGTNLYRLRQVDYDGSNHFSSVITVAWTVVHQSGLAVYPNPFVDYFDVLPSTTTTGLPILYDAQGRDLSSSIGVESGPKRTRITTAGLPAGLYLLHYGEETLRVIKR